MASRFSVCAAVLLTALGAHATSGNLNYLAPAQELGWLAKSEPAEVMEAIRGRRLLGRDPSNSYWQCDDQDRYTKMVFGQVRSCSIWRVRLEHIRHRWRHLWQSCVVPAV